MIVEKEIDLVKVKKSLQLGDSLWIPMYSDPYRHYMNNHISFIYIHCIADDMQYVLPFRHKDCFNIDIERLNDLTSQGDIYVLAKKRFAQFSSIKCYDADMVSWWQNHKMLPLDESNTSAHDAWNRWWHNETNTHDWLPITKHIERCDEMKNKFIEYYTTFDKTPEFEEYEQLITDNFSAIERTGLQVDYNKFVEHFKSNGFLRIELIQNTIFGQLQADPLINSEELITQRCQKNLVVEEHLYLDGKEECYWKWTSMHIILD
tara:strand:+ start:196 stop:981 length:786 start_codon:yes stop_codon:yes gene_type:complete